MPTTVTSGLAPTGQDFATWKLWEGDRQNDLVAQDKIEVAEFRSDDNFDEATAIQAGATTDITRYRKTTVRLANRQLGIEGTDHTRMYRSGTGHVLEINENFAIVEFLDIQLFVTCNVSDEGIRISTDIHDVIISRCLIHYPGSVAQTDGIYISEQSGATTAENFLDHNVIYGFRRAGVNVQNLNNNGTKIVNIDFSTIINNGQDDLDQRHGGIVNDPEVGETNIINVFNCAVIDNSGPAKSKDYQDDSAVGTATWAGSNNLAGDTTTTGKFTSSTNSVILVDTVPGAGVNFRVVEKDSPNFDFTIGGENAFTVSQNGTNRVGSEPDSRQDFSLDIASRKRPGTDTTIGAWQESQALPTITSIVPSSGTESGGTSVVITGTGFAASQGAGTVTVNGVEATSYTAWGDTGITIVTPSGTVGTQDVIVTNNNGDSVTAAGGYTYIMTPAPSAVGTKNYRTRLDLGIGLGA